MDSVDIFSTLVVKGVAESVVAEMVAEMASNDSEEEGLRGSVMADCAASTGDAKDSTESRNSARDTAFEGEPVSPRLGANVGDTVTPADGAVRAAVESVAVGCCVASALLAAISDSTVVSAEETDGRDGAAISDAGLVPNEVVVNEVAANAPAA